MRYWREHPSIHALAAWRWGYKPTTVQKPAASTDVVREAAEMGFPAQEVPAAEFDQHLKDLGIDWMPK